MSRSPSPADSPRPSRTDSLSPFDYKSSHLRDAHTVRLERLELSSQSSNSRDASPTDSEMSDSDHDRVKLPSIRELCNGLLPPTGSGLDPSLRDLGIVQPVPPRTSSNGREASCSCCATCIDHRPQTHRTHSAVPGFSPAVFENGSPYSWKPADPPSRAPGQRSYSITASPPGYTQPTHSRQSSYRRVHVADSDSEDGYYAPSSGAGTYGMLPTDARAKTLYRAQSYDSSDIGRSLSRPSSVHSRTSDYGPRTYHYGSPYSDTSSLPADSYGGSPHSTADSNWESHVEKAGRLNGAGPVMYTCRWKKADNQPCNYTGKKQLAKRHVESVHLGKKPHVCPECKKPFPQKTSLDIHIRSVHTFQKPLKCEHCDAAFSDPARRHKHYRVEHPDKVVKKPRMKMEFKDIEHLLVK